MKKKEKVEFIQAHIASMLLDSKEDDANFPSDDNDSIGGSDSSDSDGDEVICTTATTDEGEETTNEDDIFPVQTLFRETRSGRIATSWRRYQFL